MSATGLIADVARAVRSAQRYGADAAAWDSTWEVPTATWGPEVDLRSSLHRERPRGAHKKVASMPITSGSDHYTDPDGGREADLIDWATGTGDPKDLLRALEIIESWQREPCERIEAPPRSAWDQDCLAYMKGDEAACYEPCLNAQSVGDFERLMVEDFNPSEYYDLTLVGGESTAELFEERAAARELFAAGWKVVLANLDLLAWVGCMVQGDASGSLVELLGFQGKLWTGRVNVIIYFNDVECEMYTPGSDYEGWSYLLGGGRIEVCNHSGKHFANVLQIWAESADASQRACAAIDLASGLAHEMTHVGGNAHGFRAGGCDVADLVESTFLWALLRRYAFVAGSGCCKNMYRESGSGVVHDHWDSRRESFWEFIGYPRSTIFASDDGPSARSAKECL